MQALSKRRLKQMGLSSALEYYLSYNLNNINNYDGFEQAQ